MSDFKYGRGMRNGGGNTPILAYSLESPPFVVPNVSSQYCTVAVPDLREVGKRSIETNILSAHLPEVLPLVIEKILPNVSTIITGRARRRAELG